MTPEAPPRPLLVERSRTLLRVHGRDPVKMIHGLATADIEALTPGQGAYTAFLTPKGRMIADARVFLRPSLEGDDAPPQLLIDTAPDAAGPLQDHFRRSIPPLFAKAEDVSGAWAVLGVYGNGAGAVVAQAAGAGPLGEAGDAGGETGEAGGKAGALAGAADPLAGAADPEERVVPLPPEPPAPGSGSGSGAEPKSPAPPSAFAVSTRLTGDDGRDLFVPVGTRDRWVEALEAAGARPGSPEALEALRVAAGRPRWGRELTEDVIPLEAGLLDRSISQTKGCYTGQEVIIRILHRGHVNRHLRRLEFTGPAPEPGTELFEEGNERARGVVTSAAENEVGALGLGFVRREIEPPAELRLGSPDGPPVGVEALE